MNSQLEKARRWLIDKCSNNWYGVSGIRNGHAAYIAYLFKIKRPDKSPIWFCMDMENSYTIKRIRRICYARQP